ncbi:MAG: hypothetical protein MH472_00385 [Bacteroidia bacterium]|nr:hypothetical protein [Bacteroidia bacterium]
MNSLQLINKIKSKSEDFSENIHGLLHANQSLNRIQKDLLAKQCLDLYELLLKLKTEEELIEERPIISPIKEEPIVRPEPKLEATPVPEPIPEPLVQEIVSEPFSVITPAPEPEIVTPETKPEPLPLVQAENFQEVLNWADEHEESLDAIVEKVAFKEEEKPKPVQSEPVLPEININKVTENKRIQYTVMPDVSKPEPFNSNFKDKAPTYNEKMGINNPPVLVPLADKTIEAPIDNIKGAINLNKKIAFVKMLFNENVVEYAKAIERLNNAIDFTDAMRIHNELKHQQQWDNQNELVQELERLIKRRFPN